jgi:hypothetical protein
MIIMAAPLFLKNDSIFVFIPLTAKKKREDSNGSANNKTTNVSKKLQLLLVKYNLAVITAN